MVLPYLFVVLFRIVLWYYHTVLWYLPGPNFMVRFLMHVILYFTFTGRQELASFRGGEGGRGGGEVQQYQQKKRRNGTRRDLNVCWLMVSARVH